MLRSASVSAAAAQSSGAAVSGMILPSTVSFSLAMGIAGMIAGVGRLLM